jgi:hypothetical protein
MLRRMIVLTACIVMGSNLWAADRPGDALAAPVQASWVRLPLRDWADRVTALAGRPVIVDRRLDPNQLVTCTARGESLRDLLHRVATSMGAGVDELAATIRIVPTAAAGMASQADRDTRARLARMPARVRAVLVERQPWRWPFGARPRELVADAADEAGVVIEGLDQIPHDHFPSLSLPPLSLAERLDLVLAHFDQCVEWTAVAGDLRGRIIPLNQGTALHAPRSAQTQPHREAAAGRQSPAHRGRRPAETSREVFSLRLEAPLDQALAAIADRLRLAPVIDRESLAARGIATGEIVRASIADASRAELLDAVLSPLELEWEIKDGQLRVFVPSVATAADIAAAVASRENLPSVHGERAAVETALAAAEVPPARVTELFAAADRAILPGMVPSLDGFLFFTRDPAWWPFRRQFAEFLELPQVTAVTADLVPPLAGYAGVVTFPAITTLTAESAAALAGFGVAGWGAAVEFPGVTRLEPAAAAAIARCPALLVFPNLEELTAEAAKRLAAHEGIGIVLGGLATLPEDVAAELAEARSLQGLLLPDLTRLDSAPLARRLTRQDHAFLPRVTAISPEIAEALRGSDGGELALPSVEQLPPEVARQLVGGGYFWLVLGCAPNLSAETAAILAEHPGQLTFNGPTPPSPTAAAALASHTGTLRLPHLDSLSVELAAALGRHAGPLVLDGITELDDPASAVVARSLAAAPGILAVPKLRRISATALESLLTKPDVQLPSVDTLEVIGPGGGHHEDVISPSR